MKWRKPKDGGDIVEILDDQGQIIGTAVDGETAQLWIAANDLLKSAKTFVEVFRYRHGSSTEIVSALDGLIAAIKKAEEGK